MKKIYGLKITVTRSDVPEAELTVEMPEIDGQKVRDTNPAIDALLRNFESLVDEAFSK